VTEVVVFMGCKGGVGTTRAAVNAARSCSGSATLVDLDLEHGNCALELGINPTATIANLEVGSEVVEIDSSMVRAVTWKVDDSLSCIPSPSSSELAESVSPRTVETLVELLIEAGESIVIDGGSRCSAAVLAALRFATDIVFVARCDRACEQRVAYLIDLFSRAEVEAPFRVVLPQESRSSAKRFGSYAGIPIHRTSVPLRSRIAYAWQR
jgi:Flp pilus assembly CpaE family ATPase